MPYVDNEEDKDFEIVQTETPIHTTTPVTNNYHTKIPTFIIFFMEDGVTRRVKDFENNKE